MYLCVAIIANLHRHRAVCPPCARCSARLAWYLAFILDKLSGAAYEVSIARPSRIWQICNSERTAANAFFGTSPNAFFGTSPAQGEPAGELAGEVASWAEGRQ